MNGVGTVYIKGNGQFDLNNDFTVFLQMITLKFTRTDTIYGLRLSTDHGLREVSDISLFQGELSGGSVQAYAGGGLKR